MDLWEYEWISASCASFRSAPARAPEPDPAHRHRVRSSSRIRATETFLRSETVSSTYSGKNNPLSFFYRSPRFACCLEKSHFTRGSVAPGSLCHPWQRERLFMCRMLCPADPWVNPAVIMRSKSWHQSGEESCLFSVCLVRVKWLKADFPFNPFPQHEREKQELMMSSCVPDSY